MIQKELDIAYFLKNQMVTSLALKLLFTKLERTLLRNQAKPFVIRDATSPASSDDETDLSKLEAQKAKSSHYDKLARGIMHGKKRPSLDTCEDQLIEM